MISVSFVAVNDGEGQQQLYALIGKHLSDRCGFKSQ